MVNVAAVVAADDDENAVGQEFVAWRPRALIALSSKHRGRGWPALPLPRGSELGLK